MATRSGKNKGRAVKKEQPPRAARPKPASGGGGQAPPPTPAAGPPQPPAPVSKKDQILSLFSAGFTDVRDIATITHTRPTYVAQVLQQADLMTGYFDLYTSSTNPMNVYSKFFERRLEFKDEAAAQASVDMLDLYYRQFSIAQDRAGQHHCLVMALTMFDRARWSNKPREAEVYKRWLTGRLNEP
jgi:hypothetical protein